MKGTVFLEPGSTAAKHLQSVITDRSDDGLLFIECSEVKINGAYLECTLKPQANSTAWQYLAFAAKDVALVVKD